MQRKFLIILTLVSFFFTNNTFAQDLHLSLRFHLAMDMPMTRKGVRMQNWITPKMIQNYIMPEINRIWSVADIKWNLVGVYEAKTSEPERTKAIKNLLISSRSKFGKIIDDRVNKLLATLPQYQKTTDIIDIYIIPYMGQTYQGLALPAKNIVIVGQWSDKLSKGKSAPTKTPLIERNTFKTGSISRTISHELGHILGLVHAKNNRIRRLMSWSREPGYRLSSREIATAKTNAKRLVNARIIEKMRN